LRSIEQIRLLELLKDDQLDGPLAYRIDDVAAPRIPEIYSTELTSPVVQESVHNTATKASIPTPKKAIDKLKVLLANYKSTIHKDYI
jgi:hypothetical protein